MPTRCASSISSSGWLAPSRNEKFDLHQSGAYTVLLFSGRNPASRANETQRSACRGHRREARDLVQAPQEARDVHRLGQEVDLDARGRLTKVTAKDEQVDALITNVNLIDGNVTNVIGEDIKDDTALTTFHQGIVEKAVKVLPDNIKALFTLVEGIVNPKK